MFRKQFWLGSLLALQLVLAAGLFWNDINTAQSKVAQVLLNFEQKQIGRVVISDSNHTVTLNKSGEEWVLPDSYQLPADEIKLAALLDKLADLQADWPVATSSSAQARFEVADNQFQRRVRLYQGDGLLGDLFVGTSPGFRKVHARRSGDDAIYAVVLNGYELPADDNEWLDKTLLSASGVTAIKSDEYSLKKDDGKWQFENSDKSVDANNEALELNEGKASQLAAALTSLRVQGLAKNFDEILSADESSRKALDVIGTSSWRYELLEQDGKYYVRRNDLDKLFTLSKFDYEQITGTGLAQLAKQPNAENSEPDTKESDG
ncbi:MAG: DUF4340 domain-containing protein [Gammaproteobacteria bacterium]|nr:DUF4340 domain-containing protein [Gammaproteobacteria bacterium]MDH3465246.1 DUF4340 domain-containing protein [Gammaproteobacteria bacterium]